MPIKVYYLVSIAETLALADVYVEGIICTIVWCKYAFL